MIYMLYFPGVFSTLALVFTLIALCVHVYIFVMEKAWYEAFEEYIVWVEQWQSLAH